MPSHLQDFDGRLAELRARAQAQCAAVWGPHRDRAAPRSASADRIVLGLILAMLVTVVAFSV